MTVPAIVNIGVSASPDVNDNVDRSKYIVPTTTLPTSGLLFAFIYSRTASGSPSDPTISGWGLTFFKVGSLAFGASNLNKIYLYVANLTGSTPGSGTFDWGAEAEIGCKISFSYASGTTVDLTNGATGSIVQFVTGNGTATSGSITLAAAGHADNRPIAGFLHLANEGASPQANWTELDDLGFTAPASGLETEFRGDAFDTNSQASWVTSAIWGGLAVEVKGAQAGTSYNDSVSVSRKESASDSVAANVGSALSISQRDTVLDGMTNSISPLILISQKDGVSDGMNNNIPKNSSLNEVLSISESKFVGIFPALTLLQVLATTTAKTANAQGSVGLVGDLGIGGSASNNINPNASLLDRMGVSLSGGLSLLSSLAIAEKMGFSVLGNVGIYPSLTLGERIAFVPANIALIGGTTSIGEKLGLIDVPRLDARASLALLERLGINLSSALAAATVEAALALAERLGLSDAAQLKSYPLVGVGERLFLVDANNANMFGRNVLSEIHALTVAGGISIQKSVAIPIDLDILTNKLISSLANVSIQEKLGISDRVFANMQAVVALGNTAGMGNSVSQMLNTGLSINVVGSVLTISGLTVIIVKGFVFTSDVTRNPVFSQDSSKLTSTSDGGKSTASTDISDNYISTGDE